MKHTIETLTDLSQKRSYSFSEIQWEKGVNFEAPWAPESLNPVSYLPSYQKLSNKEKLRINQLYAAGIAEKFIFFEEALCLALNELLSKKKVPGHLESLVQIFVEEELKHTKMFRQLLKTALPEKYKNNKYYFITQRAKIWAYNNLLFKNPETFIFWVWMAAYFEEKTLVFSQEYIRGRKKIDPLFYEVHRFHLQDEARHVEIDRYFLEYFYKPKSDLKKKIARKMFQKTLKALQVPKTTVGKIFQEIEIEFGSHRSSYYINVLNELEALDENMEYKKVVFGSKRFPVFTDIIEEYSEHDMIKDHFL